MGSRSLRLFRAGSAAGRVLPGPVMDGMASLIGAAAVIATPERRRQVERNLRRVKGPGYRGTRLRRDVQATFASYGRYWGESFRLPSIGVKALEAGIVIDGWEHISAGREAGKGVILALPHLGGWEWAGFYVAEINQVPISVVVEELEPPEVFEWFVELRRSFGMHVIPLGPGAGRAVLRALHDNHVVCLLSDRDLDGRGVEVDFFGERTTLPAGPATLALRTGAPLLPTAAYFRGRGHRGVVRPPVPVERRGALRDDVARVTQLLAHELEQLIRAAPDQWHLMQPNWPSDPGYYDGRKEAVS